MSPEEASSIEITPYELQYLEKVNKHVILGTSNVVKEKILKAMKIYGTDDVSIATNCHYFEDRLKSFELIGKAFGLSKRFEDSSKIEQAK